MSFVKGLHTISSVRLFGCIGPFVKELSNRMYVANRPREECGIRGWHFQSRKYPSAFLPLYDLLGVCCGKSVCFAAVEPRLESVQIDFIGAAEPNNMDACGVKDKKALEPSPALRNNPNTFRRSWAVIDTGIPGANCCGGPLANGAWAGAASCGES